MGDVDPELSHRLEGEGMDSGDLGPGARDLHGGSEMAEGSLGHLRAGAVVGTEKEDPATAAERFLAGAALRGWLRLSRLEAGVQSFPGGQKEPMQALEVEAVIDIPAVRGATALAHQGVLPQPA